jgi:hypothetical protein
MELFVVPQSLPFVVAALLVMLIGLTEAVAVLAGLSLSGLLDHLSPDGLDAGADSWLGWLHVGKAPLLVLLVILLTSFSLIGLAFNAASFGLFGVYPYALFSVPLSLALAVPVVHVTGGLIARLIPRDETSAVALETLVGQLAVVINGTARANYPAQAKLKTDQGQTFYVRVEPEQGEFNTGDSVLLVKQISGARFLAIVNPQLDIL